MSTLTIRPFRPADTQGLYRVADDTAFFGRPVEAYLDDRKLFCDLVYRYYPVYEPVENRAYGLRVSPQALSG